MKSKKQISKLKQYFEITIGVISMAIGFYFFFLPTNMVVGGVTGLSIIAQSVVNPSLFILCGNVICLIIGFIFLGKKFFINTIYGTLLFPLLTFILELVIEPNFILQDVNNEVSKLLITVVVGGFLLALGLGLCFRNNATTGGIDVIQKIIEKYFKIPFSKTLIVTDGIIIAIGLFVFKFEITFYALIAIGYMGYFVDKISIGGHSTRTVYIITKKPLEIKDTIYNNLNRGVTFDKVNGGYSGDDYTMVICTLSKSESYKLRELIIEIDEHAFTFFAQTTEVIGDGF